MPVRTVFALLLTTTASLAAASSPIDDASPLTGTDGHGHAFPGATLPFGMVQLSPDTRTDTWDGCSGYHYSDTTIIGFSHTHLAGTGVGCLGDIMLMPTVGDAALNRKGYQSSFSHSSEVAKPGYYKVFLQKPKVTAELTATDRAGYHKYTFPASSEAGIVLDLVHGVQNSVRSDELKVIDKSTLAGHRTSSGWGGQRTVYFYLKFSKPFKKIVIEDSGKLVDGTTLQGKLVSKAIFDTQNNESVDVKVGISATGIDGAKKNLESEIPEWGFNKVRKKATARWAKALSNATVESKDPEVRKTFYSNLYLTFLAPNLFIDVDGSYVGMDHKVHVDTKNPHYSTFSLWDTYRALHPLLTILQPEKVNGMVSALIRGYDQFGQKTTPIWPLWDNETWCMIGYHSAPVVVDAYFKGFKGFDAEKAYQALKETALQERNGLDTYKTLGYMVSQRGRQAVSKTIEYSIDDWCIARMAEALGHKQDAELFYKRAAYYRNLFDESTLFFRGRRQDGSWRKPFDTLGLVGDDYTEANAWGYAFAVQHDVPGMVALYGGEAGFIKKLDTMFSMHSEVHSSIPDITGLVGQYAQGNEQCHHVAYLYDYVGQPWKTQSRVRDLMTKFFSSKPDGQIGNTDCGQMSAWYVFSALGFYPVNPANGVYAIGSPAVDKATFNVGNGKRFSLTVENNSPKNVYIQSATLNGKPLTKAWLNHADIVGGGSMKLVMGSNPNKAWGSAVADRPLPTMPKSFNYQPIPPASDDKPVVLNLPIRVICGDDEEVGGFIGDPNAMEGSTNGKEVKIDVSAPNAGPQQVYQSERYGKDFSHSFVVPSGKSFKVRLHFAELFDEEVGMRVANYYINGKKVLANFDIYKEAGELNKAVVREFTGIRADANGNIVVRIQAASKSPDQNAKICGIEIIEE